MVGTIFLAAINFLVALAVPILLIWIAFTLKDINKKVDVVLENKKNDTL